MSSRFKAPFVFTGGTIARVTLDLSGRPYRDVETEIALLFAGLKPRPVSPGWAPAVS